MEQAIKLTAAAIVAVIMIVTLRQRSGDFALLLSLCVCIVLLLYGLHQFRETGTWIRDLCGKIGLQSWIMDTLLKVCGICICTQICIIFCHNAGEQAVAKAVELCSSVLTVAAMLPLLNSAADVVEKLLGG